MNFINAFLRALSAVTLMLGTFCLASGKQPEAQFAVLAAILFNLWANEK